VNLTGICPYTIDNPSVAAFPKNVRLAGMAENFIKSTNIGYNMGTETRR